MTPQPFWKQFHATRRPGVRATADIPATARFFTMGSCFANELRAELTERGHTVLPAVDPTLHPLFDPRSHEVSSWGAWDERAQLQFYNTFSIRQEIEKAFGHWAQDPDDFWAVSPPSGTPFWQDPYRRRVFARTLDDVRTLTRALDANLARGIREADVFVFTLGLTEVWRTRHTGRVACAEPGYCGGGGAAETTFHASTYEENLANMRRVLELLATHRPDARVFVTVSPVALGRTFREDMDVSVANMESKSILRTVAATLVREHPGVTYVPSFEMCMYGPERAFAEDGRHVRRETVRTIMDTFLSTWMEPSAADSARLALRAREATVVEWMHGALKLGHPGADALVATWVRGWAAHVAGDPTPPEAYAAMRQLHVASRGAIDAVVARALGAAYPIGPLEPSTSRLLGTWDVPAQEATLATLRRDGIVVLPRRLDVAWVDRVRAAVEALPLRADGSEHVVRLGEQGATCPRLLADEDALLRLPDVQQWMTDPLLVALAGAYLGCQPVLDFVAGLLSFPVAADEAARATAAQNYHFDKDRIAFLKVFVYLTDVDEESGPHVFVAGSRSERAPALWRDGRISDAEVEANCAPEAVRRITGPRGTVFLADTSCLHKGDAPRTRSRTVLQVEYANSLFGQHYPTAVRRSELGDGPVPPRLLARWP
jgi:hypothetical protein